MIPTFPRGPRSSIRPPRALGAAGALLVAAALLFPGCAFTRWVGLGPDLDPDLPLATDPPDTLYAKGRALFAAERWDDAADAFGRLWKDHPASALAADARFYEAESRYGQGKYNGAFELYKEYLKQHPLSPHSTLLQTRLFDMGRWTIEDGRRAMLGIFDNSGEGVDMLEYLVNAFPNGDLADDALAFVADHEIDAHRPQDAVYHLHDLVDRYPASEWALEGRFRLAQAYRDLNRGLAYDADALKRSAAQYRAYIELVTSDRDRAREYAERLEVARTELAAVEDSLSRKGLVAADFYLRTGKVGAARQELRNLMRQFPGSEAAAEARRRLGSDEPPPSAAPAQPAPETVPLPDPPAAPPAGEAGASR